MNNDIYQKINQANIEIDKLQNLHSQKVEENYILQVFY